MAASSDLFFNFICGQNDQLTLARLQVISAEANAQYAKAESQLFGFTAREAIIPLFCFAGLY